MCIFPRTKIVHIHILDIMWRKYDLIYLKYININLYINATDFLIQSIKQAKGNDKHIIPFSYCLYISVVSLPP